MRSRCGGRGYIMVREEAERLANIWCHTLDRVGEEAPGLMCGRRALLLLRKKGLQNNRCDVRGGRLSCCSTSCTKALYAIAQKGA